MTDPNPATQAVEPTPQGGAAPVEPVQAPTQPPVEEEFDKERAMQTIRNLREIEKQAKQEKKELEALRAEKQAAQDAQLSEVERLKKQNAEIATENARLKEQTLRQKVASETGLPAVLVERLKGATEDELKADALELLKVLPQAQTKTPPPNVPPTNPANAQATETEAQKRARLFPSERNPLDMDVIKQMGGGVVWNTKPGE